jgi:hypothetical protein
MPADEVTVLQLCGKCGCEIGTFAIKKDNLMLTTSEQIWCPKCEEDTPEVRDIAGRAESIRKEVESYPTAMPALRREEAQEPSEAPDAWSRRHPSSPLRNETRPGSL